MSIAMLLLIGSRGVGPSRGGTPSRVAGLLIGLGLPGRAVTCEAWASARFFTGVQIQKPELQPPGYIISRGDKNEQ